MNGLLVLCIFAASIALIRCRTITLPASNFETLYTWPISPSHPTKHPIYNQQPLQIRTEPDEKDQPSVGCGRPVFNRLQSHGQFILPNAFLMTPSDPQKPLPPVLHQSDPQQQQVNCNDATSSHLNRNCIHQQTASVQPNNYFPALGQTLRHDQQSGSVLPVNWPHVHSGGVGLLFIVPESASHLPGEQLVLQHLGISNHRTQQLPIDISANCRNHADDSNDCVSWSPAEDGVKLPTTTTNYASAPLTSNVNSSIDRQRPERGTNAEQQQKREQQQQQFE